MRVDQRVTVRSATGFLADILVRAFDIRSGNALLYFPEANVLVPVTTDTGSKTPALKSVLVTIDASNSVPAGRRGVWGWVLGAR